MLKARCLSQLSCSPNIVPGAGFEPARPYGQGIFLPHWLSPAAHCVVVWTIPSSTWDGACLVSEPSPCNGGLAADWPISHNFKTFTFAVSSHVVVMGTLRLSQQFTPFSLLNCSSTTHNQVPSVCHSATRALFKVKRN